MVAVTSSDGLRLDVVLDRGAGPIAVLGHGAGSTPDFVRACLAGPLRERGWRIATHWLRGHGALPLTDRSRLSLAHHAGDLGAVADALGARAVGGISLGAHAALTWAGSQNAQRLDVVLAACPAWCGPPDEVADANRRQAALLEGEGLSRCLEQVRSGAPGWLAEEVRSWWPRHDTASLCALLRALADQSAPDESTLSQLRMPCAVAVLEDDPLHPASVGRLWAQLIPNSACAATTIAELGKGREALGRALVAAMDQLGVG